MIKYLLFLSVFIFTATGIATPDSSLIKDIESAHKKEEFLSKEAVSFDINIIFGGNKAFNGKMTMLTNSTKIKMESDDGTTVIYDGSKVYQTPSDAEYDRARFDIFTWSYFFLFPYKLSDPGTIINDYTDNKLDQATYNTLKLSFEKGVGDSPDDWYIIYADPESNVINYSAYIVTFSQPKNEAEKDPHAIEFSKYEEVDGIPISTKWIFWGWREDKGLTDKLGHANLNNIKFVEVEDEFFSKPENSKIIE